MFSLSNCQYIVVMSKRSDISDSVVAAIIVLKQRGVLQEISVQVGYFLSTLLKVLCRKGSRRSNCGRKQSTNDTEGQPEVAAHHPPEPIFLCEPVGLPEEGNWDRDFWAHLPPLTDGTGLPKSLPAREAPSLHPTEAETAAVVLGATTLHSS